MSRGVYLAVSLIMTIVFAFVITNVSIKEETTVKETETTIVITNATTEVSTEPINEPKTEMTTQVVEETTKKEVVTVNPTVIHGRIKSKNKYTDEEIYLFAQILYCEAGGESKAEMARVGQVVLNRMNTDYWEFAKCKTINQVLRQSGQYPETVAKIDRGIKPSKAAMEVAKGLLDGTINSGLGEDVYWQTGFVPDWNARVILKTPCDNGYHYYSVLAN